MKRAFALLLLFAVVSSCAACGQPMPPKEVKCENVLSAGGGAESLTKALGKAKAGDCVVLEDGTYTGGFVVPPGVTLTTGLDEEAEVEGKSEGEPALTLREGAALWDVSVRRAAGIAVFVPSAVASIGEVQIKEAEVAAIAIACTGSTCREGDNEISIHDAEVTGNELGIWASGARVSLVGGVIADQNTTRLTGGHGVVAADGAELTMMGTLVESNHAVGVLVDGQGGTQATLSGVTVRGNQGRGVWVQRLSSTLAEPGVTLVDGTLVDGNKIVGIGLVESTGVVVSDSEIRNTVLTPTVTGETGTTPVADGLGIFKNSGDVRVQGVYFVENQRTQILIDAGGTGIELLDSTLAVTGQDRWGVVIQQTTNTVDDPECLVCQIPIPHDPLPIADREIPIPEVPL
ncbi:right-handed parallel beta-helix repeat-containing protein [Myxococcota bacterium]